MSLYDLPVELVDNILQSCDIRTAKELMLINKNFHACFKKRFNRMLEEYNKDTISRLTYEIENTSHMGYDIEVYYMDYNGKTFIIKSQEFVSQRIKVYSPTPVYIFEALIQTLITKRKGCVTDSFDKSAGYWGSKGYTIALTDKVVNMTVHLYTCQ